MWIELVLWSSVCYRLIICTSTFEDFGCISEVDDLKIFTDAHITGGFNPCTRNMEALYQQNGAKKIKEINWCKRVVTRAI